MPLFDTALWDSSSWMLLCEAALSSLVHQLVLTAQEAATYEV